MDRKNAQKLVASYEQALAKLHAEYTAAVTRNASAREIDRLDSRCDSTAYMLDRAREALRDAT